MAGRSEAEETHWSGREIQTRHRLRLVFPASTLQTPPLPRSTTKAARAPGDGRCLGFEGARRVIDSSSKGERMAANTKDETDPPPESAPAGTWALLCLVLAAMVAAWLFLYFGVFLPRGTIH